MKSRKLIIALWCIAGMLGCSKKEEECPKISAVLDAYNKEFSQIKTDITKEEDLGEIKTKAEIAQQKIEQLNNLQLTDEKLLSFKSSTADLFSQTAELLKEMPQAFSSIGKTAQMESDLTKSLEQAEADLKAACDKKERRRRARRKKRRECKKISAELENAPTQELDAEKIATAVDKLKNLSVSRSDLKASVDAIAGVLEQRKKLIDAIGDFKKKSEEFQKQLDQLTAKRTTVASDLQTYCTAD